MTFRSKEPPETVPRLRLHVTAAAAAAVRAGHPWIYAESVREQNRPGQPGDLAAVYTQQDKFLAIGLFDPGSPLRVRVLHTGKAAVINEEWWRGRLRAALERRRRMFDAETTGYRWVHGESDGWPGLVLDRYESTLVAKLYTAAWLAHWPLISAIIQAELQPERFVLRLSRNLQARAAKPFRVADGQLISGPPLRSPVTFLETGLWFEADVVHGQKTGFFLDQRENRRRVENLSGGKDVLNLFSFSGGFSLYAARGGARSVTDVDISRHALESAIRNFALNQKFPAVGQCRHVITQADVFEWLQTPHRRAFDLIVLDPPSLAKRASERAGALEAYRAMVRSAVKLLRPRGILVAASCSAHVPAASFFEAVRASAAGSGVRLEELGTSLHPPDHPANFPEAAYLKCIYLRLTR